jgi:UDP-N-acetylmuramoyl-tripeptide--D-alanyl-D-alanine ligase
MKNRPLSWFTEHLKKNFISSEAVTAVEFDSRRVEKGNLFFALPGKKVDGHSFLKDVAEKGACAAVVSKEYQGDSFGLPLIIVEVVTQALHLLAKKEIEERNIPVTAVTGSVGKTTTKEFLASLLQKRFRLAKTPGNANSQVGFPVSILNSSDEIELFVVEMGMTASGEISRLIDIAPPVVSLITRVGTAHVGGFADGIEGIARAKAEIFSHPKTRFGLFNAANAQFEVLSHTGMCAKKSFAFERICSTPADFVLKIQDEGFVIEEEGKSTAPFHLPFYATHLCEDFIAAAAAARLLGLEWEEILERAQALKPFKWRFEKIEKEGVIYINDAYNANPVSMRAAFANLPKPETGGKRIGVLGTMVDLGTLSEKYHQEIGEEAATLFDHLLCFGQECIPMLDIFQKQGRPVEHFSDLSDLRSRLFSLAQPKDVVLIKGSNSTKLWQLLE